MQKFTVLIPDYVGDKPIVVKLEADRFSYTPKNDYADFLVFFKGGDEVARFSSYSSFWNEAAEAEVYPS